MKHLFLSILLIITASPYCHCGLDPQSHSSKQIADQVRNDRDQDYNSDPLLFEQKPFFDDFVSPWNQDSDEPVFEYVSVFDYSFGQVSEGFQEYEEEQPVLNAPPGSTWQTQGVPAGDGFLLILTLTILYSVIASRRRSNPVKTIIKHNTMKKNHHSVIADLTSVIAGLTTIATLCSLRRNSFRKKLFHPGITIPMNLFLGMCLFLIIHSGRCRKDFRSMRRNSLF